MDSFANTMTVDAPAFVPEMRPRLSDVLFEPRPRGFDTIATVPSNIRAVESAMRFANGVNPFVVLVGPSGWGKSHLLEAVERHWKLDSSNGPITRVSGIEWQNDPKLRAFNGALILDNAQDLTARTRSRIQLQLTLERRFRAGRPTLLSFTKPKLTRSVWGVLPTPREWVVAMIKSPTPAERERILTAIAKMEGVDLSALLIRLLANELDGNGRTLSGAMNRLKLTQRSWLGSAETLRACGVLTPFFTSNSDWDLREHIADVAKRTPTSEFGAASTFDLTLYAMLKVALLPETCVSSFFRIEQGKAYAYATRFSEKLASTPDVREAAERFIDRVVDAL